ncbi:MAG TPA: hypothetical protein PLT82_11695 [Candidatus Hydrogenedens sp.]|nr:hypothetical protein [Candidatus Hydrogenedens sp.]HOK10238.1 hypothetical protein [Candidatus Hydrogenedens sp.]HOL20034.1 hypothetical protein [Candidatus Hydrogenedens sp.]HPP59785.1 hypothetical protein [Candidatus Hydrogenedens sp.]
MDLSGLKWPLIILIIVGVGWLASSGGVNYMIKNFTKAVPGQDAQRDKIDEAGLTRVAGYLMMLLRWERAKDVLELTIQRYGNSGANYWYNMYRLSKCYEKLERYQEAYNILRDLAQLNAHQYDERVPEFDNLNLRASKLKEVHDLR